MSEHSNSRLNSALNHYADMARLSAPSQAHIKAWRASFAQLTDPTAKALGNIDQEQWVSLELHLPTHSVRNLRTSLLQFAEAAQVDVHDPGKREWAKWGLFHQVAPIYEQAYGTNYTTTFSEARGASSGQALQWTEKLLELAASRPEAAQEIKDLSVWARANREGLASRIKEAREELLASRDLVQSISDADRPEDSPST